MTQEEKKNLLLRDLCARLPYHVRCKIWLEDGTTEEGPLDLQHNYGDVLQDAFYYDRVKDIKPYLRPMSSMTEEEKIKLSLSQIYAFTYYNEIAKIDWLNAHHFDYRGLIDRGLAIEVTEENNSYESTSETY